MHRRAWLIALTGAGLSASLGAALPEDWDVSGYNAVRVESYETSGTNVPYPHTGGQFYDEFSLGLSRRVSPHESWEGQFSGVANASDYRSGERGGILERARVVWEKGDASVPYRLEAGDFHAALSPRVIQRALKGAQIEFQPGAPGRHSLQLFSGLTAPIYRNLGDDPEQASGISWLLEDAALGGLSVHAVDTRKDSATLADYRQRTWGLGWSRLYRGEAHELEAEAEWARFSGEHAATGAIQEDQGDALFLQVAGRAPSFDYRLRHGRYGAGFRPLGGAVSADQRGSEAHLGWLASPGLQLRGRLLDARDNLSSNPLTSRTLGLSLSGTPFQSISTWLDLSQQTREDRKNSVDGVSRVLSLSLGRALGPGRNLRGSLQWNGNEDHIAGSNAISRQIQITLDQAFVLAGWQGGVSPGVLIRRGSADQTDYNPALRLSLRRDAQEFSFSHSHYQQDAHFTGGIDSLTRQTAVQYAWNGRQHRFDLEASHYDRDPTPGAASSAHRLAATWTWRFDRPAQPQEASAGDGIAASGLPELTDLRPGLELATLRHRLEQTTAGKPLSSPGVDRYELTLLDGIETRQRLFLEHEDGRLRRAVLAFDPPAGASPADLARLLERVAERLFKRLGAPQQQVTEGDFTAQLDSDLMLGRFKRWTDWRVPGGVLRLGVPARNDGPPRLEIVIAESLPAGSGWGGGVRD